jgi:hypothetical protein
MLKNKLITFEDFKKNTYEELLEMKQVYEIGLFADREEDKLLYKNNK